MGARLRRPQGAEVDHLAVGDGPHYSFALTDTEWSLVTDLFERLQDARGAPPRHERRQVVDACCYVLRNGCA